MSSSFLSVSYSIFALLISDINLSTASTAQLYSPTFRNKSIKRRSRLQIHIQYVFSKSIRKRFDILRFFLHLIRFQNTPKVYDTADLLVFILLH